MHRFVSTLSALLLGIVYTASSALAADTKTFITPFPTLASVQNVGSAAAQYPNIFVVSYTASGGGVNFTWVAPCPAAVAGIAHIAISGVTSGCYVEAVPIVVFSPPVRSTMVDTTVTIGDSTITVDASGGARTVTFPLALGITRRVHIEKIDTSTNPVIISNGSTDVSEIVTPAVGGQGPYLDCWTNGSAVRCTGIN